MEDKTYNDEIEKIAGMIILASGKHKISFAGVTNDVLVEVDELSKEITKIYVNNSTFQNE